MKKTIRCAGYALKGVLIALAATAVFTGLMAGAFYAADVIGGWFEFNKDQKGALMFVLIVCIAGAVLGAVHCHERHRFDPAE